MLNGGGGALVSNVAAGCEGRLPLGTADPANKDAGGGADAVVAALGTALPANREAGGGTVEGWLDLPGIGVEAMNPPGTGTPAAGGFPMGGAGGGAVNAG